MAFCGQIGKGTMEWKFWWPWFKGDRKPTTEDKLQGDLTFSIVENKWTEKRWCAVKNTYRQENENFYGNWDLYYSEEMEEETEEKEEDVLDKVETKNLLMIYISIQKIYSIIKLDWGSFLLFQLYFF